MQSLIEFIGWYAFLGAVIAGTSYSTKAFYSFVVNKASCNENVYFTDTLIASFATVYQLISRNLLVSACTISVFILVSVTTKYSIFAAFGYASITYAIGAIITPLIMRAVKPLKSPLVASATNEVSDS